MKEKYPSNWGSFFVVAVPIGNPEDITLRALRILKDVDLILCEDAKTTTKLCKELEIATPTRTLYKSQGDNPYTFLLEGLKRGQSFALVSDAGTPGISDPGAHVIRFLREETPIQPIPVPGPSALTTLLSITGWQANPTLFLGFLSEKPGTKRNQLEKAKETQGLIVFYESVHKMPVTTGILAEVFPDIEVLVGREMTKTHEEYLYYPSTQVFLESPPLFRGEFCLVLNNTGKKIAKAN